MFGLKSVYFYLLAVQITLIKILKKFYFSSKNYNKSLESITPQQVYYSPNPFLLSIITSYKSLSFKINDIDPNIFWVEDKKKNYKQVNSFLWLRQRSPLVLMPFPFLLMHQAGLYKVIQRWSCACFKSIGCEFFWGWWKPVSKITSFLERDQ